MSRLGKYILIAAGAVGLVVVVQFGVRETAIFVKQRQNENYIRSCLEMSRSTTVNEQTTRVALLAKFPIGSKCDQVLAFLETVETNQIRLSDYRHRCRSGRVEEMRLAFKIKEYSEHAYDGLDIRFAFDSQNRLTHLYVYPSS